MVTQANDHSDGLRSSDIIFKTSQQVFHFFLSLERLLHIENPERIAIDIKKLVFIFRIVKHSEQCGCSGVAATLPIDLLTYL